LAALAPTAKKGAAAKQAFALGTSLFPTPISGLGGPLVYSSGSVSTLTPIPKTGFLGRLRFTCKGTIQFSGAASAAYTVPIWRIIQNYTLQNSLNYPYRSWNGGTTDDLWLMQQVYAAQGGGDPLTSSLTFAAINPTITTAQTFSFTFTDEIWHNADVNFSRFLLSAMTTSNDLTINMTWAPVTVLQQLGAVISAFGMGVAVSAEYLTVPNPAVYNWPRRNLIQQQIGDPSFNRPSAGLNAVNLTPIQGPEFLGIGVQIIDSGTPIALAPATTPLVGINLLVNGSIPLYQWTTADLIANYERLFRRSPGYGTLWLDFSNDLGLVNAMSHTHRKVLSTAKYSQLTLQVQLSNGFAGAAGSLINLAKRLQASYANNN
jgi:hypothetical protein